MWLQSVKVSVLLNGTQVLEISCKRGLQHSDPLSLLIFVIVANGLHHMIAKHRERGLIKGLECRDESNVVVNLHNADDTLIIGNKYLA